MRPDPGTDAIAAIRDGLPPGVELDEREEALLDLAARQANDVERAEADIEARGYLVPGSRGQDVINPSIGEARQGRLALGKLLGQSRAWLRTRGLRGKFQLMPGRPCSTAGCPNFATAKGMCDFHRRKKERERSVKRRGGYKRGPMTSITDARDRGEASG